MKVNRPHTRAPRRTARKRMAVLALLLGVSVLLASCSAATEEMVLFRRKISRVDMLTQQVDLYSADTTIAQLISNEQRSKTYDFSENTQLAFETAFMTVPATVVYSFADGGTLSKIAYFFDFSEDGAESEVEGIYRECIKFFGYPDTGVTQGIYEALYEEPKVVWIKNNAEIALDYSLDDNLRAHAVLRYNRSSWSGTSVAVFKLPFNASTLGEGIGQVVANETKNNSETIPSVVEYVYRPNDKPLLAVRYVFRKDALKQIQLVLLAEDLSARGMRGLNNDLIAFLDSQFSEAFREEKTDGDAFDVRWSGEAISVALFSPKDTGNREVAVTIDISEYLN